MKVSTHNLERLNRWEFFGLTGAVIAFAEETEAKMPDSFKASLSELRTVFEIYDEEIALNRRPSYKPLMEAEKKRDTALLTIFNVLHAYSKYTYSPQKMTAAKTLLDIFKKYGTAREISRQDQSTKIGMIISLLQELATEASSLHIATLSLEDAVRALYQYDNDFSQELSALNKLQSKYVTGVARNARLAVQHQLMSFIGLTNGLALVEGEEKYADLKLNINAAVQEYVTAARLRTSRKELNNIG